MNAFTYLSSYIWNNPEYLKGFLFWDYKEFSSTSSLLGIYFHPNFATDLLDIWKNKQ